MTQVQAARCALFVSVDSELSAVEPNALFADLITQFFSACEIAGLSDEWRDVQFNRIRVENLSGNQGVKWQISRKECKKIMGGDYSDVQIEKGYLGRERFRQF